MSLGLKGVRDESMKSDLETLPGGKRRLRLTEYGRHVREAQRVKWYYGVLQRQFRRYFHEARRRPGNTEFLLLQMLECRLDNVVYLLQMALTRAQSRQMVVHRHVRVNGKVVKTPSHPVRPGDVIEATSEMVERVLPHTKDRPVPTWLRVEAPGKGVVVSLPTEADVPKQFEMRRVVEFMAR